MPAGSDPFSYAILRVVPDIDRGERLNVGVVLFCRQRGFLAARVALDRARFAALAADPSPDRLAARADELDERLHTLVRVAAGDPTAGPIAALPASERFGWLTAPASTSIQPSEVHTGLCADPQATLDGLYDRLVEDGAG